MRIRIPVRQLLFTTLVLLLMLAALVYSYPTGILEANRVSEQVISYFQE